MFCVRSIYLNMPPIYLSIYLSIAYCDLHVNACICMYVYVRM